MTTLDNITETTGVPAVLEESSKEEPLTIVIIVSCFFTCLISTYIIMLHIGYKLLRSGRSMIRLCLLTMLCLTELCYVAGMKFTDITAVCTAMAAIFHMSCISTFNWLFSYILYLGNDIKKGYHSLSVGIYVMIGCVIPMCFVLISLIWRYQNYRETTSCWISSNQHLDWALKGPVIAVILMSAIMLIFVIKVYITFDDPKQKDDIQCNRQEILGCSILLPTLGLTWLFGIFYATEKFTWLGLSFAGTNFLLGVMVFICVCLFNSELTHARERHGTTYKRLKEKLTQSQERDKVTRDREGRKTRATAQAIMMSNSQILKDIRKQQATEVRRAPYCMPDSFESESTQETETNLFSHVHRESREPTPGPSNNDDPCLHVSAKMFPDLDISDEEKSFDAGPKTHTTVIQAAVSEEE